MGLTAFPRLPRPLRRAVVRVLSPSFTVGCVLVLRDGDRMLLLEQRHHDELTLPGGLLRRGEDPRTALHREVCEEIGLDVDAALPATAVVDAEARRVDLVFTARLDGPADAVRPDLDEAVGVTWRRPTELLGVSLPTLQVLRQLELTATAVEGNARVRR